MIHAQIEIFYINLLLKDFSTYSFGLSWSQLYLVHHIGVVVLFIVGILFGYWQGRFWWKRMYEKKILNM
ncbi:hypothetical protein MYX06_03640, partial [Patescibacteria group bacterium AH-259-L05]|nr:hypothetical protein [Patescibacteria group bacterium AH-259-L05]